MTLKSSTKTKFSDNLRQIAEGSFDSDNYVHSPPAASTFVRMIVLDVISDPNTSLKSENKKTEWQSLGISNMRYADTLPRNTIIAKKIGEDVNPMFVFPFFPSHLSMPCKPGECMWVMFEKPDAVQSDMAFWFCRVVEPHISDDVNHTHIGASLDVGNSLTMQERAQREKSGDQDSQKIRELRNGPTIKVAGERRTSIDNLFLKGEPEDIFEKLITQSDASKLMSYASIPRFRKRPGDVVLEGSNNSLVVLGTDRQGPIAKTRFDSGAIDIVAGRGQTKKTSGKETSTFSIIGSGPDKRGKDLKELKKELEKNIDDLVPEEGDPDFNNDRSRILVSQRTEVDKNFKLSSYNSKFSKPDLKDSDTGDAAIIIKSDKIRMIARSDVEILVTGFDSGESVDKKDIKNESGDTKRWSSIVIKSNGDIVFTPSEEGVIKLGGEEANLAVLCEKATIAKPGLVTCPGGITDTMGGKQGISPEGGTSLGTFAKKVLMK